MTDTPVLAAASNGIEAWEENPMEYRIAEMETSETQRRIEHVISRAFLTAHLLTASTQQAENAVTEALASWDPHGDNEGALLDRILEAAVRAPCDRSLSTFREPDSTAALLPAELRAVLRLPSQLRRCFVLRILVALSRQSSAELLHLRSDQVDQYTAAALQCLPDLGGRFAPGIECFVWTRRFN